MRYRTATILALSAFTVLALTGCSDNIPVSSTPSLSASAHQDGKEAAASEPLSSAELSERLLDESDLGAGYARKPEQPERHADVTVTGCPELAKLGGEAAAGGGLAFPRRAKASFAYGGGSGSEVAEELYSATETNLSDGVGRIFEAMTSCSTYQVLAGDTPVRVAPQRVPTPQLGEERWSHLLTFTAGGRSHVVKQTAVRVGMVVVVISGSPALVDAHVETAVAKARVTA
ncbi:hypothetical protein P8605_00775 [Streptomyces sp. T-3]|nr:hypothetical protein [Streptomyces sp. T-3]